MSIEKNSLQSEKVQAELDKQFFHLRTLYDVSHELLGLSDVKEILKSFLLMTMGNFGAVQGFIMALDLTSKERAYFEPIGFYESDHLLLEEVATQLLAKSHPEGVQMLEDILRGPRSSMPDMVCVAAFKVDDHCSGLMGLGRKLNDSEYTHDDLELVQTLVNNLAVCLKNARYAEALKKALDEIRILNSAKDKVINHLAHELKTPIALVMGCLAQMEKKLPPPTSYNWPRTLERAQRNVKRLSEIQYEVEDIMKGREYKIRHLISSLLDQCADGIDLLVSEKLGEEGMVEAIRHRIEEIFGPKEGDAEEIFLEKFTMEKVEKISPSHSHREVKVEVDSESVRPIWIPRDPLEKVLTGLIRNAIENTPDEGMIKVSVKDRDGEVELCVRDWGVGIVPEHQQKIFEGFFPTQDTDRYATGKPFAFNAGGRGADLLRMKIFSERFNFKLTMTSTRCKFIPTSSDLCAGRISRCSFCKGVDDCYESGGTTVQVLFPAGREH